MADPNAPASIDPFGKFDVGPAPQAQPQPAPEPDKPVANDNAPEAPPVADGADPFAKFDVGPAPSSATGAFARGAEKAVVPAAGSLAGAGAGAELGGALGTMVEPGLGSLIGGAAGGIAGGIFGAKAVQTAQDWAVNKLPDTWKDAIGFGDKQAKTDEAQHSNASFLGGLVPYALTLHPNLAIRGAAADLPEGATALQRILANPTAAKLFGGGLMGGMEIGNEKLSDQNIQWPKVAIATVFGTVFSRPNRIGEAITEYGASPARTALGIPHPTLAQAADLKVMGPGITEPVFHGTQQQSPEAALTAQENARQEQAAIGEPPEPDLHGIARQMEPETFQKYDDLLKQRDTFQTWHGEGPVSETAERHLAATNAEIAAMSPDIAAAYRRARDTVGTGQVEAEPFGSFAEMLAAREAGTENETTPQIPQEREPVPVSGVPSVQPGGEAQGKIEGPAGASAAVPSGPQRTIGEQRAFIADDVSRKLIAAGRPPEEAEAYGKLVAAKYITRAGWFEGKLGTPEELYAREGAAIAGPNRKPINLATDAPVIPTNRSELARYIAGGGKVEAAPQELSQAKTLEQTARGEIRITPNRRSIISILKEGNASTFGHELGHDWLEQLMRDSDHPDAPAALRDDAQTVRDWLGVTDDIKTKHHEKFARGFEQYLREGVAPSPELAGVFAKFRNWLLSIYQSIKGLGTEISPDIRSVFDRMLEQEPQRTVIAPDRPPSGPLLHEVHEGDATHAEPHEADALADRVAAESTRAEQEPPPEVANEIAASVQKVEAEQAAAGGGANAGAENGGGAGPSGQVEPGSGGPEPESAGGVMGGGAGAERGGGNGAETESAERPNGRSKLGDHAGTALAPGPADLFGARQSPFTDRAGNIRVENLTTREDVAQAIRDSAAENNDFIGDRRGVITDGQVLELADALGMDAASLNQRQLGQAFNAEQIVAARKLLIQSATDVSAAMKKAAIGTDEDVMAYAQAKDRHQLIQAQVAGITAEAGRALRAFRSIAGEETAQATDQFIKQATGKTLFQLRAEAKLGAQLQTPQQVSKFMQDAQKFNFGRVVLEYWINGLISGPATHMTYMVGNTISAIMKLPEAVAAAGVSRAAAALGREGTGTVAGEAGAMVRGFGRGLAPALKASVDALRTGITTELPSEGAAQAALPFQPGSELAQGGKLDEAATFHDAMSAAFGLVRGMRDTVMSTAALVAAGGVPGESLLGTKYSLGRATPDITFRGVPVLPLGAAVTLPGRGVAVLHSFYRSLVFSMEKNAMAYRTAVQEGHTGTALDARVAELRSDPSQVAMNEAAAHEATESALMGRGSELTQRLASLTNVKIFGAPLLKFIDPFVRVSGNIIDQSLIRRTPVGLLTMFGPETELARDLTGKNGNVAQDKAIGRMMVGTTLAVTFGSLAAQKLLSGSGPKDPKEAKVWMMAGNQPHSVRVGDTWYQVNKLGPVGMLASISADLYDVAHEAEEGDFTKAGAHLLHAITQNVLDESAMHGPAELLKAVETPDRYGESYVRNYLAAFVPYSVGLSQMARAMDPYQRDTKTMIDTIRNKIPGHLDSYFGNELPVRRDIWGEPLPSRTALVGAGVSAIYEQQTNADPVNQAMWKVGVFPGTLERKIHNVPLTAEQYDDFQRIAGRMAKMRLDKMVISPQFQQQIPSVQHDWMNETIKQSRESARQMMMIKNPLIARQALEAKQSKKQAINDRNPDE